MSRILVTGVGAVIGYGVLRALRAADPSHVLIGADIFPDAAGRAFCDVFLPAPLTASPDYPGFLAKTVADHEIELIVPCIEQDVTYFAQHKAPSGVRVALNRPDVIQLSNDKWRTHELLGKLGLPAIPSALEGDFATLSATLGAPFLLKPRRGYAGKGIVRIGDERDFAYHGGGLGADLMAQRIVGDDDAEFTVSGFGDGEGGSGPLIALQRKLSAEGATAKARTVDAAPFRFMIDALCGALRPIGPTNFQFRLGPDGPLLLEINPRISSATSIRRLFGYNEAAMCVDYYLHGRPPAAPTLRSGEAVRYIDDLVFYDRVDL